MKIFKTAAILLVALAGLASCSKDDNPVKKAGEGMDATLNLSITTPTTRATAASVPGDAVDNFTLFITDNGTGDINTAWSLYVSGSSTVTGHSVTTAAEHVYVIANGGDLTSSITSLAQLNAYIIDLNTSASDQDQLARRWATGKTASALSFSAGNNPVATATVACTFVAARITVTVDNQMTNYGSASSLTLDDIAVLNAGGASLLYPNSGSMIPTSFPNTKYYTGIAASSFTYWPAAGDFTVISALTDALNIDPLTGVVSDTYYYYVFENDGITETTFPTIVTLIGDNSGTALYWPVHLAPYEQWGAGSGTVANGVERGNSYDITIKLTGDAENGGGGTVDPTKPTINASVDITVTVTPWVPVNLGKEFN